jgi:hypothetical protein
MPPAPLGSRAVRSAAAGAVVLATACASWHRLDRAEWERATAHRDVFTTRLRVTRLDGERLYLEQPRWTATQLLGVYPPGWPRAPGQDTVIAVPRDCIAGVERLESSGRRTALYLLLVGGAAGAAALAR